VLLEHRDFPSKDKRTDRDRTAIVHRQPARERVFFHYPLFWFRALCLRETVTAADFAQDFADAILQLLADPEPRASPDSGASAAVRLLRSARHRAPSLNAPGIGNLTA